MYLKLTDLSQFNFICSKESLKANANVSSKWFIALHAAEIFHNFILRNHWTWTWKISDYLTGLVLPLYIGFGIKKYLNYQYIGIRFGKYLGVGLILWYNT